MAHFGQVLFYLKKHVLLELLVALVLGGGGLALGTWRSIGMPLDLRASHLAFGLAGAGALSLWTLLVQTGHAVVKGRPYAQGLTRALARHFAGASPLQMFGAALAAAGEEVFFRGFVQGAYGVLAGAVAFMLLHIGAQDIRVIGYWSFFQGLGLGLLYAASGNLLVPILAHALFDCGAMVYFKRLMETPA